MKKMLFKSMLIISCLLITFFSVDKNVYSASFSYNSFNWESFLEQHKNYWVSYCPDGSEECQDEVIKTQKKFYTTLYKLLAEYERRGYTINDNYIIETVYYGLTPDTFRDPGTKEEEYIGQELKYAYNIDESETANKYIGGDDDDIEGAKRYFEQETDSLKTLLNNMIGYSQECYGVSPEIPHMVTTSDGKSILACEEPNTVPLDGKCVAIIKPLGANFFDKIGLSIFGNNNQTKCDELANGNYASTMLGPVSKKQVNEELYWDFLINNKYFDNKFQLQYYFSDILAKTNHKSMSELSIDEYKEHNDELVEIRTKIVDNIKEIIKTYGEFAITPSGMSLASKTNYWWPIGSSDVTTDGIISLAIGEPESTRITSKYGKRVSPKTGMHYGIDIGGELGITNIIAAKDGIVVYSSKSNNDSCPDSSDLSSKCGGGYGNYVILQHTDGNYTVYAHLANNSITVSNGDNVTQGQVIAKMGSSGSSTGAHLHFEVRIGGNSSKNSVDPLTFVSKENPRSTSSSSNLVEFLHSWEGKPKESGDNYIAFDDGYGNVTIGYGVVPKYNKDRFLALGINPNTITIGSFVPKNIVDQIETQELSEAENSIRSMLSSAGITLTDYQVDALISRKYNYNVKGFTDAYKKYGNTEELYTNYMSKPTTASGKQSRGLVRRREAEWALFSTGNYSLN